LAFKIDPPLSSIFEPFVGFVQIGKNLFLFQLLNSDALFD
jgi:hypothetical protein